MKELQAVGRVNIWLMDLDGANENHERTLSGKVIAFEGIPDFPARVVPSPPRLKPTRFAADAIQLLPCVLLDVEDDGVEFRCCALDSLVAVCWVEERVGDMKRGDLPLVGFSSVLVESRA